MARKRRFRRRTFCSQSPLPGGEGQFHRFVHAPCKAVADPDRPRRTVGSGPATGANSTRRPTVIAVAVTSVLVILLLSGPTENIGGAPSLQNWPAPPRVWSVVDRVVDDSYAVLLVGRREDELILRIRSDDASGLRQACSERPGSVEAGALHPAFRRATAQFDGTPTTRRTTYSLPDKPRTAGPNSDQHAESTRILAGRPACFGPSGGGPRKDGALAVVPGAFPTFLAAPELLAVPDILRASNDPFDRRKLATAVSVFGHDDLSEPLSGGLRNLLNHRNVAGTPKTTGIPIALLPSSSAHDETIRNRIETKQRLLRRRGNTGNSLDIVREDCCDGSGE